MPDSYGLGIPLPSDSTKLADFPKAARAMGDAIAAILAGGVTDAQRAAIDALVEVALRDTLARLDVALKSDPGMAVLGEKGSAYALLWKNHAHQIIAAITADNYLQLFKGLRLGPNELTPAYDDEYVKATRDRTGRPAEDALLHNGTVPAWVLKRWKNRMGLGENVTHTVYTVKPDGSGDFRSPKLANDAFTPGPGLTCEIVVHPGTYTETEWIVKDGVTIRGTIRDACRLQGALPVTANDADITATSTLWLRKTARLENLTITARNMRYPVHSEASGAAPDARHDIVNCWIEHHGNDDVVAYRAANGLPAGNVWNAPKAWGYGSSSGIYERFENVTFVSPTEAWYVHDNKDFDRPINHDLIGCRLIARAADGMISLQSLGSGQSSRLNIYGSEVSAAFIYDTDSPWNTEAPEGQVSQHSQIAVTMDGLQPVGYRTANRGRALKIESASTGAVSSVLLSGSAAADVFGAGTYRAGGGGLKGYAYGYWDISGIKVGSAGTTTVPNTLGRRLGNCSGTSKTLVITLDGATRISVLFDADYRESTNATILAKINAALGSAGAATEYAVTQNETYPDFTSRQRTARNAGTVGIPRFAAVKGAGATVQAMTSADPASAFAGIAVEPIPPGEHGRVLTSGLLYSSQLPGFEGSINTGTPVYLTATPGRYSATGTVQALTGYISGWARF